MSEGWLLVKSASEIGLKSGFVRQQFMKALEQNIKNSLKARGLVGKNFFRKGGRIFFNCESPEKALKVLKKVFGIHAIAIAAKIDKPELSAIEQEIGKYALKVLKGGDCFAVRAKVIGKHNFNSHAVEVRGGAAVLKAVKGLKVNLSKPDVKITAEVFEDCFFLYSNQEKCFGGLPVKVSGRIGFIVGKKLLEDFKACWLLMKRGCEIVLVGKSCKKLSEKLKDYNCGLEFFVMENAEKALRNGVVCFAKGESALSEKSLKDFEAFDEKLKALVLRPLLLAPKIVFEGVRA